MASTRRGRTSGPPPRARGRRHHHDVALVDPGTTPRGRGDDNAAAPARQTFVGPPPRARGRPPAQVKTDLALGTTPAGAGTTTRHAPGPGRSRDHPRGRGDDRVALELHQQPRGPPPRARGRPGHRAVLVRRDGTTPAGAGTTRPRRRRSTRSRDHPRGRGDDPAFQAERGGIQGPPPRARGRLRQQMRQRVQPGTTPAGAGTTRTAVCPAARVRDHPRGRGDDNV